MGKYFGLLKYEANTIIRDPVNVYMFLFPVLMLLMSSFWFPVLFESIDPAQEARLKMSMLLVLVVILAFGTFSSQPWLPFSWWSRRMKAR